MLVQSKEVRDAWRASQRTLDIKVVVGGKTYTATDINSLKYDSGAYTGDTFAIGSTYSNSVQIEFSHLIENLNLGMEVVPSIGVKTSSGYVYEPLGVFIISSEIKMDRNNNLTTVSASDKFCGLEGAYTSKLTYPAKVLDVIAEICAMSGVEANVGDLSRLPHQEDLPLPITGQSYRKALGWIAQLYAGYATFDRQGLFTIRTITEPNYELDPSQYEQAGLTKNEAPYKINGIQCQVTTNVKTRDGEDTEETKTLQVGDANGAQVKLENNIMTAARLNAIWEQLKDITFYPFSLNWFGNPAVEAGDWLRLKDKQGNSFIVPNNSYTLDFNGGLSATSKADQTTSSDQMVPWQGSVAQAIKELQGRRAPDGTVIFPPSVVEPPKNAKINDVWFKKNGNATELWVFERQDDGTGKWIRKDLTEDEIKHQIEQAQSDLNQAKADITTNKQKADTDIENLNKSIAANKKTADNSLQRLSDSITKLQGQYDNNIVPDLTKVTNDVADALQKYISAQNNIADLTKQAQQQGKSIADVTKTTDSLNINYANLLGDVNSTKVDVKGMQTTLGNASGDIAQLKLDAQNLQTLLAGKVDNATYTNFVNLTNQALNAKLTASDLNGYAKTADLQATANGLKFNIDSVTDRMNNLKIGGRNLILNSDKDIIIESKTTDVYPQWDNKIIFNKLKNNTTYTFSTSATNTNNVQQASVRIWAEAYNGQYINKQAAQYFFDADGKRHSFTFTTPDDGIPYNVLLYAGPMGTAQNKDFATTYHHPQLELGTIASDYRPAPEDTEHSLTELSARITATSQQFSSYYTKSETDNRTNSAKNEAINTIKNDGNWQGLSNILTNSGFLQSADGFLQKVQQTTIPMFNGGGVNLVQATSENEISGKSYDIKDYYFSEPLEPNTKYTISIDAKVDQAALNHGQFVFVDPYTPNWSWGAQMSCVPAGLDYKHYKYTFTTPMDPNLNITCISVYLSHPDGATNGDKDNLSGIGYFKKLKVERGEIDTPYSHAPSDNASLSAFSELSQSLEGLRSTVSGNYGQLQNTINQTNQATRNEIIDKVAGLQSQITTTANGLNAKIGAIQVGGRNLLIGTSENEISGKAYNFADYQISGGLQPNKTYTLSGWGRVDQEALNHKQWIMVFVYAEDWSWSVNLNINASLAAQYNKLTFTTPSGKQLHPYVTVYLAHPDGGTNENNNDAISGWSFVKKLKLEEGNIATDYTHAPEDTEKSFTEVNAAINGLQSTVSNNYGQLQSLNTQTATAIRNEVTDRVNNLQGQITTQANNINLMIGTVGDLSNICRNPTFDNHDGWTDSVHVESNWPEIPTKNCGVLFTRDGYYGKEFTVVPGDKYYTSVFANNQNDVQFVVGLHFKMKDGSDQWLSGAQVGAWECRQALGALTVPNNAMTANIWVSIQKFNGFGYTRFTNVIVKKNDTLAQINMSAGTTLIQNDKIYMDASSTVFSGNAFIPSAAITSLNADKITTGTLNAANVNIINLNANNITAGTLTGSNGQFYLDSGALHVWQGNHNAWIDSNGIHDYDNQRSVWIRNGEINFEHQLLGEMQHTGTILTNSENSALNGAITIKGDRGFLLSTKDFTTNYWSQQGFPWGTAVNRYVSGSGILGFDNNITVSAGSANDSSVAALIAGAVPSKNIGNAFGTRAQPGVYIYGRNDANKDQSFIDIKAPAAIDLTTLDSYIEMGSTSGSQRTSDININSGNYLKIVSNNSATITAANSNASIFLSENQTSVTGDAIALNAKNYISLIGSSVSVSGDFGVLGKKNAVVSTSRGMVAINAYETAEYYFGDIGETQTNSDGVITVMIDPFFLETVNTVVPYQVFLTSYGDANVWIASRSANCFVVKSSKPNIHFAWEIKAKRKGYENDRMEIVKGVN